MYKRVAKANKTLATAGRDQNAEESKLVKAKIKKSVKIPSGLSGEQKKIAKKNILLSTAMFDG